MGFFKRTAVAAVACTVAWPSHAATVVVGVPDWPSAQVTAHIIGQLLEDELGVTSRLRTIGGVQLFGAIDRGEVDVHPEVWLPNMDAFVAEYADDRGTLALAPKTVTASQSMCTTRASQEATGLRALSDLADPEIARHFDTNDDGRGEVWIGDFDWSSTRMERIRAQSYGYDETMQLLTMPEDMAMAALDAAVVTGQPMVFYCYEPHFVFDLHEVVRLDEPDYDPTRWLVLTPEEDPAWLTRSMAATAYAPSTFRIGYAANLADSHPKVVDFLDAVALTTDDATKMSYAVSVEGRDPEQVAADWIETNADRWQTWVSSQ